ncbi:MAG: 3-dehydro-L-gulonate 2-dehydrogenase, partial [Bacteroidetes bacterium]|nr:3-dehydro-L-gulonate 2-dehydrogenase [Bacteroidota bacterium]
MYNQPQTLFVAAAQMQETFVSILQRQGFTSEKAQLCAQVFTDNSIDGVYTHGVNRFPRFVRYVKEGYVKPDAEPLLRNAFGAMEQWDGQLGPGPLNAMHATRRAMALAEQNGIGCVALSDTNHWMRGGSYGWQAAKAGYVFVGWTNTIANMPAWGARDSRLGNNPLIFALPFRDEAIVLDAAMSQYSFGAMEMAELKNESLAVYGGYDSEGRLTNDPAAILKSRRPLPVGYWKGAGMALLLDLLATMLSGGLSTAEISRREVEYGLSQVFICISAARLPNHSAIGGLLENIIADYKQSIPVADGGQISYPGERVLRTRADNRARG